MKNIDHERMFRMAYPEIDPRNVLFLYSPKGEKHVPCPVDGHILDLEEFVLIIPSSDGNRIAKICFKYDPSRGACFIETGSYKDEMRWISE